MATTASGPVWVVGVDGSAPSGRAVDYAIEQARVHHGRLIVLAVVDWHAGMLFPENIPAMPVLEAEWFERAREDLMAAAEQNLLRPAADKAKAAGVTCTTRTAFGSPSRELMDLAQEQDAAAVVVGRSGKGGLRPEFFGGVASAVLHHAAVPVHIVP